MEIDSPLEKVISLFDNPSNLKHWQDGFVSFERIDGKRGEVGSTAKIIYLNKGKRMELIETLMVYNLPKEITGFYHHYMMDNEMQNLFDSIENDRTRWTANIHYTRIKGIMKIFAWIAPSMFRSQVQKWMNQFKSFVEKS